MTAKRKKRKPKFEIGQVVALWSSKTDASIVPLFYRIKSFFYDGADRLRYTFDVRVGDSLAIRQSVPYLTEEILRPLTAHESGHPARKRATR